MTEASEATQPLSSHNPLDPNFNPYPAWAASRPHQPVAPIEGLGDHPLYLVLSHELVDRVLRDNETFSSKSNAEGGIADVMGPMIVGMDGTQHKHYRDIVARAFRPSAMERWEHEIVVPTVHALIDEFAPAGRADLVTDLTSRFPVRVIAAMLGAEEGDFDAIHHWTEEINLGPANPDRSMPAAQALRDYLTPIVEDRRANPREDLVSDIVHAEVDGESLDDEHIYGFLRLLFPAGAETTFRVFGSLLASLLLQPEWLERVRDDRSLAPQVIEETLRWETAVTIVSRVTTRDVELGGVELAAGTYLLVATGAANRDPGRFSEPDAWDPARPVQPHLSFGTGRHQCLGMHLARMELRIGLDAVLDRLPNLRLDPAGPEPSITGFAFRGPDTIPVLFDPS
ncbi:MAG TPA: cytochrome P450 [Acidimicrobiia bacterium]|nr:cytochrome P450 [Acidimicrobiia bacterium]